jgi:4-hydroxy-3-methylbut-2-enyl diphosphate reductase
VKDYCRDGYQIVITGKKEHPEVLGLLGHCPQGALVVQSVPEAEAAVDFDKKTLVVAQTTISRELFTEICDYLSGRVTALVIKDTTCNFVANRHTTISSFAETNDVVIFVGGRNSSNSKMLYTVCKRANENSHWIEIPDELLKEWFVGQAKVGITGGASTPWWLLQQVSDSIEKITR